MKKLQCAVIGIGGIGKWHGQMMQNTGQMKVAAVCDANEKMRAVAKEEFPSATFYTSAEEMLKQEKLELVGVITPHHLHAPIAIAALNAGANVHRREALRAPSTRTAWRCSPRPRRTSASPQSSTTGG